MGSKFGRVRGVSRFVLIEIRDSGGKVCSLVRLKIGWVIIVVLKLEVVGG